MKESEEDGYPFSTRFISSGIDLLPWLGDGSDFYFVSFPVFFLRVTVIIAFGGSLFGSCVGSTFTFSVFGRVSFAITLFSSMRFIVLISFRLFDHSLVTIYLDDFSMGWVGTHVLVSRSVFRLRSIVICTGGTVSRLDSVRDHHSTY